MPKGPKGENRPADVIGAAIMVAKIATGEAEDAESNLKARSGRLGGKVGGIARARALTPEERKQSAQRAAKARWRKK